MQEQTEVSKSEGVTLQEQVDYWKREALGEYAESPEIVRLLFAKDQALDKAKSLLREMMTETEALAWECISNEIKNVTQVKGRLKKDLIPKIEEMMNVVTKPHEEIIRIGDIVIPKKGQLRSGGEAYSCAIVISVEPFIMVSKEADMKWGATYEASDVLKKGEATMEELHMCFTRAHD